jgi:hypothetical protein
MGRLYDTRAWRALPREGVCAVHTLTGDACKGSLAYHHVQPVARGGEDGPLVLLCARHHPVVEALARRLSGWKRCPHRPGTHRYPGAKEACERSLNSGVDNVRNIA